MPGQARVVTKISPAGSPLRILSRGVLPAPGEPLPGTALVAQATNEGLMTKRYARSGAVND